MNAESGQTDNPPARKPDSLPTDPAAGIPQWMSNYPPGDEIDLVDLGVLLWRRRRVMLVVFLVFFALTIVGTIIKSPTYSYSTGLQLGSTIVQSSGSVAPLMSAPTVAEALQNTYIPQAEEQYLNSDSGKGLDVNRIPKITASGTAGGDSVLVSCKAKESRSALCTAIETIAVENFISNNTQFATAAKNQLASLQAQAKVLQVQMDKLNTSAALYQQQATDLEHQIAQMQKAGIQAARSAANGSSALSNLILNTEVQRATDTLNSVKQQLEVSIPQQRAQLSHQISDNANAQQLQEQNINLGFARMVNAGLRSIKPVGLTRWAVLGIGIIISIILAIFAAFTAAYFERIRERLHAESRN